MSITLRLTVSALKQVNLHSKDAFKLLTWPRVLPSVSVIQSRTSFFRHESEEQLWGSLTGLSNVGRKRGRGRGTRKRIDLNKGQWLGDGKAGILWPGLNMDIIRGRDVVSKIVHQGPNEEFMNKITEKRYEKSKFRRVKLPAILRGWTGNTYSGRIIDKPDPVGDFDFEGFETRVIELKKVANITGTIKTKHRYSCAVIVGNKNGLAGYALAKATSIKTAMKQATNKAAQHLQYIDRFEDHTLYHNFFHQETATKMFCFRKEEGYGLVCHRCLKTVCEVIGIKNMYAKIEGSTKNVQNITKGFLNALRKQETHQELADRMKLHVVELRQECGFLPIVVASPQDGEVTSKPPPKEELNFETLYFDGKLTLNKKKRPFFAFHKGHLRAEKERQMASLQKSLRHERIVYGIEPEHRRKPKEEDS